MKIYAEYYNHTLSDYLIALRAKKANLTIDEVVYIIKSVVNALIAFRSIAGVIQKCTFGKSKSAQGTFSSPWKDRSSWVLCSPSRVPSLKISTIDSFQGQEAETILLSLVRSNESNQIGFLSDYRRMNVAMTRAKECLIIIGDSTTLAKDDFYNQFLNYVEAIDAYKSVWELGWWKFIWRPFPAFRYIFPCYLRLSKAAEKRCRCNRGSNEYIKRFFQKKV